MTIGHTFLAFAAGVLSILSPCVLPILPVVLGTAASSHRHGPLALAAGLSLSFVAIGLFLATIGHAIGLDAERLRYVAASLVMIVGAVLLLPPLQARLAVAAGPIGNWADSRFAGNRSAGIAGQFWIGVLLGAVWSPCVGPTLGAASLLAAQGTNLAQVALTMLAFGVGAALPLLGLGWLSRETMVRWRSSLLSAGSGMKSALGAVLLIVGALILTGMDKAVEAALVEASPAWLTDLTTRF
ncbi:cytochrome c biogenesis CcdA family protein [Bradyrhizobium sediminis]|uniref:Cytochrome c biogenesis CcdA family protein n=1 Tax=Bradyrhizobium sediminis TaxID=2840469 RepID=A0A975RN18_9BRAD|nr:cytochrome c biogenesis CcdA family protein [Bradyrhizobium sediminis]QWG14247.1 cytochrome c biogenesis CcdA family protein [Bradyrhizobium sediminis]